MIHCLGTGAFAGKRPTLTVKSKQHTSCYDDSESPSGLQGDRINQTVSDGRVSPRLLNRLVHPDNSLLMLLSNAANPGGQLSPTSFRIDLYNIHIASNSVMRWKDLFRSDPLDRISYHSDCCLVVYKPHDAVPQQEASLVQF